MTQNFKKLIIITYKKRTLHYIPGNQKGLFNLAIQLRAFCYSAVWNTATGCVF
jgi:hypothetical protein